MQWALEQRISQVEPLTSHKEKTNKYVIKIPTKRYTQSSIGSISTKQARGHNRGINWSFTSLRMRTHLFGRRGINEHVTGIS